MDGPRGDGRVAEDRLDQHRRRRAQLRQRLDGASSATGCRSPRAERTVTRSPVATRNDFTAWGLAAIGGRSSSPGRSPCRCCCATGDGRAGRLIVTDGGLTLAASNPMGLQSIAAASLSSGGSGISRDRETTSTYTAADRLDPRGPVVIEARGGHRDPRVLRHRGPALPTRRSASSRPTSPASRSAAARARARSPSAARSSSTS